MKKETLLHVNHLTVQIHTASHVIRAVDDVSFTINRGEIFALVGESGCGKTMTALSVNRLLPENARLCEGSEIILDGLPLHQLSENNMRKVRGAKIGMVFQDPGVALNPVLTIGQQIREAMPNSVNAKDNILSLLEKVKIADPLGCFEQYPHQLSGGMKQRIVIAMALAQSPDLLIADEPTTALDVTTQAQVLNLIKELNQQLHMAILLIAHDLGVVGQLADTVGQMYAGHMVEKAPKTEFFNKPLHPYSQLLFAAIPEMSHAREPLAAIPGQVPLLDKEFPLCRFKGRCPYVFKACEEHKPKLIPVNEQHTVRCHWYDKAILATLPLALREMPKMINIKTEIMGDNAPDDYEVELKIENLKVYFPIRKGIFKRTVGWVKAVNDLSLTLMEGQTLALVGESGSGKTTVGKAIVRLVEATSGKIEFQHKNLLKISGSKLRSMRGLFQMIFQDPFASMDPRMQINDIIAEGMLALKIGSDEAERQERIDYLLSQVGLSPLMKERYPHQLSGGQRQRVAIARALAVGAQLIVCDEPTSALDVSVQAQILNLLKSLQEDLGISFLFITHNIGVVQYLADTVAVMYQGNIVEYGPVQWVLKDPQHPYTQRLLAAVPKLIRD